MWAVHAGAEKPFEGDTMKLRLVGNRSSVPRRGHYSGDRTRWYDESRHRWYPVTDERETVEIELEDVGGTSWFAGLGTTLGYGGAASVRFVGRVTGPDGCDTSEVVKGAPFMRLRSIPDDLPPEEAWAPDMNNALVQLQRRLQEDGWLPAGKGERPWAYRYSRPLVDWAHPFGEQCSG